MFREISENYLVGRSLGIGASSLGSVGRADDVYNFNILRHTFGSQITGDNIFPRMNTKVSRRWSIAFNVYSLAPSYDVHLFVSEPFPCTDHPGRRCRV